MTFPLEIPPRDDKTWIQTYTGKQAWPLNPHPDDIAIEDIAHALSLQCRYTGHTLFHYSVAQHSFLMSFEFAEPMLAMWALLHDASEAYLCDIARPIKSSLPNYQGYEDMLMRVIADKFDLPWPMPEEIKEKDLAMLVAERNQLLKAPPIPWHSTVGVPDIGIKIAETPWYMVKKFFLQRYNQLKGTW